MRLIFAMIAGGVFGAGLYVSGMTDTTKVQGWLDVFGDWDPTLAFVFAGALAPMFIAWRVAERRQATLLGDRKLEPPDLLLDRRLIAGSAMFGAGWGLSGFCPGPSMASITYSGIGGMVFFVAMIVGMIGARFVRL